MKKLILLAVLFMFGCGGSGNVSTDPANSRIRVVEDYWHNRHRSSSVRVTVVEDTKTGKMYFVWGDKSMVELGQEK